MRKLKTLIGVLLIITSIAGLLFWELKGRDILLLEEVIAAKEDIEAGEKVDRNMFHTIEILKENKLEGALTGKDLDDIHGRMASQLILKNDQVSSRFFRKDDFYLKEGESFFVIEPEWITMLSSSLRRGDLVDIYGADGRGIIGTYQVAFVKDVSDREVKDANDTGIADIKPDSLDRTDSTAEISHFEIIATMDQYQELSACIYGEIPTTFIVVQKGDKVD